jgi:uncharacterized integral membrane protein
MKTLSNLFTSSIFALWLGTIAIFSIQNIQSVVLKFFSLTSIQIPVGVLLSFCAGMGAIVGSLLPLLWQRPIKSNRRRSN